MSEREAQKTYWQEHSSQPTVEAMMLDSKAAEIDQLERPEVSQSSITAVVLSVRIDNAAVGNTPACSRNVDSHAGFAQYVDT